MAYTPQDFSALIGLPGFSDQLLQNHFKLYEGYVKNTNLLLEMFQTMDKSTPEYAELKRRFGWEFNGVRLHELYFANMTKTFAAVDESSSLAQAIVEQFGSMQAWQEDFEKTSAMRGIGWTILYVDPVTGQLVNCWINEHDVGHLSGGAPLLILDVFEHAYMLDYGVVRADYIAAFMKVIDWKIVSDRFDAATK